MRILLAVSIITFLIACGTEPNINGISSSTQETKNYIVITDGGESCNVMIRRPDYSYSDYTLQCQKGTKIACIRVYDSQMFILATRSSYVGASSYGLVAADGYGNGSINVDGKFNSIASVSLHGTLCN